MACTVTRRMTPLHIPRLTACSYTSPSTHFARGHFPAFRRDWVQGIAQLRGLRVGFISVASRGPRSTENIRADKGKKALLLTVVGHWMALSPPSVLVSSACFMFSARKWLHAVGVLRRYSEEQNISGTGSVLVVRWGGGWHLICGTGCPVWGPSWCSSVPFRRNLR
jgi:hypothetical protein